MNGSAAIIPPEAFASMLIAWIFPAIFLRSRRTLERFARASERLPPDFAWMLITMAKKLTSDTGTRSCIFMRASPRERPRVWDSTT